MIVYPNGLPSFTENADVNIKVAFQQVVDALNEIRDHDHNGSDTGNLIPSTNIIFSRDLNLNSQRLLNVGGITLVNTESETNPTATFEIRDGELWIAGLQITTGNLSELRVTSALTTRGINFGNNADAGVFFDGSEGSFTFRSTRTATSEVVARSVTLRSSVNNATTVSLSKSESAGATNYNVVFPNTINDSGGDKNVVISQTGQIRFDDLREISRERLTYQRPTPRSDEPVLPFRNTENSETVGFFNTKIIANVDVDDVSENDIISVSLETKTPDIFNETDKFFDVVTAGNRGAVLRTNSLDAIPFTRFGYTVGTSLVFGVITTQQRTLGATTAQRSLNNIIHTSSFPFTPVDFSIGTREDRIRVDRDSQGHTDGDVHVDDGFAFLNYDSIANINSIYSKEFFYRVKAEDITNGTVNISFVLFRVNSVGEVGVSGLSYGANDLDAGTGGASDRTDFTPLGSLYPDVVVKKYELYDWSE